MVASFFHFKKSWLFVAFFSFVVLAGCSLETPFFQATLLSHRGRDEDRGRHEEPIPELEKVSPPTIVAEETPSEETVLPAGYTSRHSSSDSEIDSQVVAARYETEGGHDSSNPLSSGELEENEGAPLGNGSRFSARSKSDARKVLSQDLWCENLELARWKAGELETPISTWRWYHSALEQWRRLGDGKRPEAALFLDDDQMIVASNAAISLAREGKAAGRQVLLEAVQSASLSLKMRNAAVEAIGLLDTTAVTDLTELYKKFNSHPDRITPDRQSIPSLEEEILIALSKHQKPYENEIFTLAASSRNPEIRLRAVELWRKHPPSREVKSNDRTPSLPEEVIRGHADGDPRLREAVMTAIGRWHPPEAIRYLKIGLRDRMIRVKRAAILSMGTLGGEEAIETLRGLRDDSNAAIRAAAAEALTDMQQYDLVFQMSNDQDARVRVKVAEAMEYRVDRDTESLFRNLLGDSSPDVQIAAVEAVSAWPLHRGGPLLLEAMAMPTLMTRKLASERLARKWGSAGRFPYDAFAQRREEDLEAIKQAFVKEVLSGHISSEEGSSHDGEPVPVAVTPQEVAEVKRWIERMIDPANSENRRSDARLLLSRMEKGRLLAALRRASEVGYRIPEAVYTEVLAEKVPVFESIEKLADEDLHTRRRVAEQLQRTTEREALDPLAARRIYQLTVDETDEVTLARVLEALHGHPYESVAQLAHLASGHASTEVRKQACRLLGMFSDQASANALIASLDDPSVPVLEEAIRSLGERSRLEDIEPLKNMLTHPQEAIAVEAATALYRLGEPAGLETIRRFLHSENDMLKLQVVRSVGEFGRDDMIPLLISLLDEGGSVRSASLDTLARITGRDFQRGEDGMPLRTSQQVDHWKKWYRRNQNTPTS